MGYYPNEATIKANFIDKVLFPLNPANISIFELPIGNSRVDMCKVNGHSAAYEIKTDLDTFDRLEGQLSDYFDVFETVYVVTSEKRWQELPSYVPMPAGFTPTGKTQGTALTTSRRSAGPSRAQTWTPRSSSWSCPSAPSARPSASAARACQNPPLSRSASPRTAKPKSTACSRLPQAALWRLLGALLQSEAAGFRHRLRMVLPQQARAGDCLLKHPRRF